MVYTVVLKTLSKKIINHRRCQNVVKTSVTNFSTARVIRYSVFTTF